MFLQIFHSHEWSEFHESGLNDWAGHHEKTIYRYCKLCGDRDFRLIALECTKYKRIGKWCDHCLPIAKDIERKIDSEAIKCYKQDMENKNLQGWKYQEPLTTRNLDIYRLIKEEGLTFEEVANKYGITRARAYQIYKRELMKQAS